MTLLVFILLQQPGTWIVLVHTTLYCVPTAKIEEGVNQQHEVTLHKGEVN